VCLVLALPALAGFWFYEQHLTRQGKAPLVAPALLTQRQFRAGNLTNLLNGTLWNGTLFLFSIYLQTILHFTPLQSGLSMTVGSVAYILASGASTTLVRYLGRRNLALAAGIVMLGNLLVLLSAHFLVEHWGIVPLLVAFFILACGQALFYAPLMPRILEKVNPEHIGTASGVYTTMVETSGALGVSIVGIVYAVFTLAGMAPEAAFALTILLIALFARRGPYTSSGTCDVLHVDQNSGEAREASCPVHMQQREWW
jgi:MFS family permease